MPEKYIAQYKYEGDNCVYFLNAETGKIQKICDIESPKELPAEVLRYFGRISKALGEQLK
jgi:hypothetical protein